MTTPELEESILRAVEELRIASGDIDLWSKQWALADFVYREAKAVAYLQSDGTVDARKAQVDLHCGKQRDAAHTAEALLNAAKLKKGALETEISAYQTIARVRMSEMGLAGRYET